MTTLVKEFRLLALVSFFTYKPQYFRGVGPFIGPPYEALLNLTFTYIQK